MATTVAASDTGKEGDNPLEFPNRVMYFRTTNEDLQSTGHQTRVENWIRDFEKNRQIFVFPSKAVNSFAACILVLGLLALIFQVNYLFLYWIKFFRLYVRRSHCINIGCFVIVALCFCAQSPRLWYLDRTILRRNWNRWSGSCQTAQQLDVTWWNYSFDYLNINNYFVFTTDCWILWWWPWLLRCYPRLWSFSTALDWKCMQSCVAPRPNRPEEQMPP